MGEELPTPFNSDVGYIPQIDLHNPDVLHDIYRDFPPSPINEKKKFGDLGKWRQDLLQGMGHSLSMGNRT